MGHCLGFSQFLSKMQICIKILSINFELSAHLETMPDRILILKQISHCLDKERTYRVSQKTPFKDF